MNWMRVGAAALLTGACALLVACGSGVVSDFDFQEGVQLRSNSVPGKGRIMVVGDDFSDVGQDAGFVYSVRDSTGNWVQQLAAHYGVTVRAESADGWVYAQGRARVNSGSEARSVEDQVTDLLADAGGTLRQADLVLINGGMWDIIDAVKSNGATDEVTRKAVLDAADTMVKQVQRLVNAGAGHVAVTGVYDLGTSPWASYSGGRADPKKSSVLSDLVVNGFNGYLQTQLDAGAVNSLYLDAALFYRLVYDDDKRNSYLIDNAEDAVCSDPGLLQGCDKSDVLSNRSNYDRYLFADDIHFTPRIWRWFGSNDVGLNAYQRIRDRWG